MAALTPEEREKLRLTLAGMASSAWNKYPQASAGDLIDLWRQVVTEADKLRKAQRRFQVRVFTPAQERRPTAHP